MKETYPNHVYIKVTTFIENFIGQKIYHTHCIPLHDKKIMEKRMYDLIDFCTKNVPTFVHCELVDGEEQRDIKLKK